MAQDLEYRVIIRADGSTAVQQVDRVSGSMDRLGNASEQANEHLQNVTNGLIATNLAGRLLEGVVDNMSKVAAMADDWNNLQARIALVTSSTEATSAAMEKVREVADATSTDIGATGNLYTTLARALKSLGDETTNAADLTKTIAEALQLSGRGASESNSAITQLSQALASGVLRGDEFNSMMENGPRLMQALADALGTTTGKLRAMAEQGKLTADIVVGALKNQAGVIDSEYSKLPDTIGRATTRLSNGLKALVGDFDDVNATSQTVAAAIGLVTKNLDSIATVAAGAGMAGLAAGAVKAAESMGALATATIAARAARAEQAVAERTALAVTADTAAANARAALSFSERAAAAAASSQVELAAAERAVIAAESQLASLAEMAIFGAARASAERDLAAALLTRAAAEEAVTVSTQVATNAQIGATAAASTAAAAQTAAAATAGVWASSTAALSSTLVLLKSPLNAILGATSAIVGYEVGGWMREAAAGAEAWYNPLQLVKGALDGLDFALQGISQTYRDQTTAEENLQATQARHSATLKQVAEQTGITFESVKSLGDAVDKGAIVFDRASNAYRLGAVSMEVAHQAVTKLDAALLTQAAALDAVAKREETAAALSQRRENLSISLAKALGDEATAIKAAETARAADVVTAERAATLADASLANSQARLSGLIAEAAAGKGLVTAKQAEITAMTEEVEKKKQAVAAAQLAVESAQSEQIQSKLAAETYGDQSAQLTVLQEQLKLAAEHSATFTQSQAEAANELGPAQRSLSEYATALAQAMESAAAGNTDAAATVQTLGVQLQAAQVKVAALKAIVEGGTTADEAARKAKNDLAVAQARVVDATKDLVAAKELELQLDQYESDNLKTASDLRLSHLNRLKAEAAARGDVTSESIYGQKIQEEEIATLKQLLELKKKELAAAEAVAAAKQAEANADGNVTAAEKPSIANAQQAVATKQAEVAAIKGSITAKDQSSVSTRTLTGIIADQTAATRSANDAFWANKAAQEASAEAADQLKIKNGSALAFMKFMADEIGAATDSISQYSEAAATAISNVLAASHDLYENVSNLNQLNVAGFIDNEALQTSLNELSSLEAGVDAAKQKVRDFEAASQDVFNIFSGLDLELGAMAKIEQSLAEAAVQAKETEIAVAKMSASLDDLTASYDDGSLGLSDYISKLQILRGQYASLSDEDVSALTDALDSAKSAQQDLTDTAKDGLDSWKEKLYGIYDQEVEIQKLNWQSDLLDAQTALIEAKKNGNAEEIAALNEKISLINEYYQIKVNEAALADAQQAIDDAAAAAAEADRLAGLSAEERQYEATIATLKQQLADAIEANDAALKQSILDQIAAEKARHELVMANTDTETNAKTSSTSKTSGTASGSTTTSGVTATGNTQPVRTVNVNITTPSGKTGTVQVLEGQESTLEALLKSLESGKAVAQ